VVFLIKDTTNFPLFRSRDAEVASKESSKFLFGLNILSFKDAVSVISLGLEHNVKCASKVHLSVALIGKGFCIWFTIIGVTHLPSTKSSGSVSVVSSI